jgi:PAS domain S-box-containing protein
MSAPKTAETPPPVTGGEPHGSRLETELRLLLAISSQIAGCDELEPALAVILREICETAGWPLGQVWMPRGTNGDERLVSGPASYSSHPGGEELNAESALCALGRGEGLVGRAWAEQSALWMTDIDTDPAFRRQFIARKLGLKAAFALPIIAGGQSFAVIEFLMEQQGPDDLEFADLAVRVIAHVGGLLKRIAAESALRQSERRFASFMQHLPAAALIRDAEGRYLFINAFIDRTTQRPLKDWLGKTDAELGTPGFEEIQATDRIVLDELKPVIRILQTGGRKPRHWMVTKFPLLGGPQSPPMIGTISLEITEQKRAEDAAREGEERLRLLIDGIHDYAIYTLDREGKVTSWNVGALRLKGYTAEEIIGQHFSCFYTPEDRAAGKPARMLATASAEGRAEDEGWRVRKDGSRFWASAILRPMHDENGALLGYAKITRDLTERRRAEDDRVLLAQTAEALRVRDEILSFASHEMRTPLQSLQLQLEKLRRERDALSGPNQQQILERIDRAYTRMAELVESFLQYSRLQGRIILKSELVDLNALAAEVVEELRPQAQRRGLRLVLSTAGALQRIESDQRFLRLILVNLIGNAIKFSEHGAVEVTVVARDGEHRISVRDRGPGIAPADQIRIFEPFERGESISHKHIPGVGLGLALVKRMSEAMGARIELESKLGAGSTFTLTFPGSESRAENS